MGIILVTVYTCYVATSSMSSSNKMITYILATLFLLFSFFRLAKG